MLGEIIWTERAFVDILKMNLWTKGGTLLKFSAKIFFT